MEPAVARKEKASVLMTTKKCDQWPECDWWPAVCQRSNQLDELRVKQYERASLIEVMGRH